MGSGRVLDALETAGLANDTLVIATTDHGIAFPDHKCSLTVHGTGVFLILRAPGRLPAGHVTDAMVSHLDLYPTICDLLGTDRPDWLQGKSLLPHLRGDEAGLHDSLFAEVTFHAAFEPKRSVRTARWNYIRNFAAPCPPVLPNCDDGPSKRLLMTHGMATRIVPAEELYDLVFDPQERHNLADDPALRGVLADHRLRLAAWMKQTDDPLLDPDPAHALPPSLVVNPRDGEQPSPQTAAGWDPVEWTRVAHSV